MHSAKPKKTKTQAPPDRDRSKRVFDALMDSHNFAEALFRVNDPTPEMVFGVFDRIHALVNES